MIKNIKAAMLYGLLFYVSIFLIISIIMFIPKIGEYTIARWALDWIAVGTMSYFSANKYFQKNPGHTLNGITLGIFWFAISSIFDLAIVVPFFIKKQASLELGYDVTYPEAAGFFYYQWQLWIGFLILIAVTTLASRKLHLHDTDIPNRFPDRSE